MPISKDDGSPQARARGECLARRFARSRRPCDLDELIAFYRPLAQALSHRYVGRDRADDLEQVAAIGLIKAARRFDPAQGSFRAYAIPTMLGEMKHFCRANDWSVHVPRPVQERLHKLRELSREIEQQTGRAPAVRELAAMLEIDEADIVEAITAEETALAVSLDHVPPDDAGLPLSERIGAHEDGYDRVDCLVSIQRALPELSVIERQVVRLRFADDLSQREIGDELGIPPRRVGKILTGAIDRLTASAAGSASPPRRALAFRA